MELREGQKKCLDTLITPLLGELGLELLEIKLKRENSRNILDIVIDNENGVTLDECASASHKISLVLDIEEIFPFEYSLEVGSPGVFRELKGERDFQYYLNHRIKVIYRNTFKGRKQFVGILKRYNHSEVTIEGKKQTLTVELEHLKKIHLFPDL
jgi:ribosome maturation factor RimP